MMRWGRAIVVTAACLCGASVWVILKWISGWQHLSDWTNAAASISVAGLFYVALAGRDYGRFIDLFRPHASVGGQWVFFAHDGSGRRTLYGTFYARHSLQGATVTQGICWDARLNDPHKTGRFQGEFMGSQGGLRLVWLVVMPPQSGAAEAHTDMREPYSGVAILQNMDSRQRPIQFGGQFSDANTNTSADIRIVRTANCSSSTKRHINLASFFRRNAQWNQKT